MKSLTRRLGCRHLPFPLLVLVSGLLGYQAPALAQQVNLIPNTATANFRDTPGGPFRNVTSNTVTVPVAVERLELIKIGDRGAAEPGDTIIYRVQVRNSGGTTVTNLSITDTLPLGLSFVTDSPRATLSTNGVDSSAVTLAPATVNGRVITLSAPGSSLAPQQSLTFVYAAVLTPDAVRGSGRNLAVAEGIGPGGVPIRSNEASHLLRINPGILSDCGTLVGRVFVDKNFDGEQQPGEPGVPNAVVFLDDGNRITTDADGLFSLPFVLAGYRTGTLDVSSLPGYTLAPNLYRIENNSTSRLVKLSPGGMARMNFAVTPSFREGQR